MEDQYTKTSRIKLGVGPVASVMPLAEGNPGAMKVLMELLMHTKRIDPRHYLGNMSVVFQLDFLNITGDKIWMLYNDLCEQNIVHTVAVLRGYQMGLLDRSDLWHAIENGRNCIHIKNRWVAAVREALPEFCQTDTVPQEE